MVAGAAAGPNRLWKLAISIAIVICGQRPADQPRRPHLGRTAAGERLRISLSLPTWSTTIPSSRSNSGCWKRRGTRFKAGSAKTCGPAYDEFCATQATWLEDYALFRALKAKYQRRVLPGVARRVGSAETVRSGRGAARVGKSNRSVSLCTISAAPPGRSTEGVRSCQGREA